LASQICQEDYCRKPLVLHSWKNSIGLWDYGDTRKAETLATLYLEDISDFIVECVDDNFGFSRAERLGRSANSFDELYKALQQETTYIDDVLLSILKNE
jgi:hypothetical protein